MLVPGWGISFGRAKVVATNLREGVYGER